MCYPYSRRHQAAERTAMRRWLRTRGIAPVMGQEPSHTELLMKQVLAAGGDPGAVMAKGRAELDARIRAREEGA